MKKYFYSVLCFLLLFSISNLWANHPKVSKTEAPTHQSLYYNSQKSKLEGFNIKLSPSIFWKTMVLELEHPIGKKFTIGLNVLAKLGTWDGVKANRTMPQEDYLKNGVGFELAAKYYFTADAPEGFYAQANAAYNNIFYFDGNTRPFSFYSHWREQQGATSSTFIAPQPFHFGLGVGYQVILLPKHFIGNVMIGTQGNFSGNNEFQFSLYLAPSLGYVF